MDNILKQLNAPDANERLENLQRLLPERTLPPIGGDVNNHIHTTYSFSPYSPAAAAFMARNAGLCTAGIMDHDTIAGAREFLQAAAILGLGGTCGVEARVSFGGTPLAGRRINNPDQEGIAYMLLHAVPHRQIDTVDAFFAPLREKRNERNRRMLQKLNGLLAHTGIRLDFERDVLPLSEAAHGGSVTERHLASALANALQRHAGRGAPLAVFLEKTFERPVGEKYLAMFADADNPYFHYDLIGWIKAELVPMFYIDADEECPNVRDLLALAEQTGSLSAYAYLGDVGDSVTGDKRAQAFEDSYLDTLFDVLDALGFRAVTYMPTRNTPQQIARLRAKIAERDLIEISGEDINQPRQSFVCMAMRGEGFDALRESAWAMIAHEREAEGLISPKSIEKEPDLQKRIASFAQRGRGYAEQ